jgi:hypothetical protein
MAKKTEVTEQMRAQALQLHDDGLGIAKIAKAMGRGNALVTKILKEEGRYQNYYLSDEEKQKIVELRYEGCSAEIIADSLGRSKWSILKELRNHNIHERQLREIIINRDHALVPLTRGKHAIVDLKDVDKVRGVSWFASGPTKTPYAAGRVRPGEVVYLHRYLMDEPEGLVVDHINHETLDNRRTNLRSVTERENQYNGRTPPRKNGLPRGIQKSSSGKYFGTVALTTPLFDNVDDALDALAKLRIEILGEDMLITDKKMGAK